jgi:hypothetical protein
MCKNFANQWKKNTDIAQIFVSLILLLFKQMTQNVVLLKTTDQKLKIWVYMCKLQICTYVNV